MQPRFVGRVNFAPKDPSSPDLWQLEEPFAQVTSDGHIIVCIPWKRTDGASIPPFLWTWFGHPFDQSNPFWAVPHDQGYHDECLVLDLATIEGVTPELLISPMIAAGFFYELFAHLHQPHKRIWFDRALAEGMVLQRERYVKRACVYAGVRTFGGGRAWEKYRA